MFCFLGAKHRRPTPLSLPKAASLEKLMIEPINRLKQVHLNYKTDKKDVRIRLHQKEISNIIMIIKWVRVDLLHVLNLEWLSWLSVGENRITPIEC